MAGLREALFGSMAVRAGLISEEQLQEGLDYQAAERAAGRAAGKLGEILVARNYLKPEQIQAILDGQASQGGGKFGEVAVRLRFCPPPAVDAALKAQQEKKNASRRVGEIMVEAGTLRAHHVVAILECQGLSLECCPGCGQAINLPKGAAGIRCPGCSTALSSDAAPEPVGGQAPEPEAPAASPEDAQQVAAAVAAKPARAATFGGYQVLAKLGANASGGLYLARKGADGPVVTLKVFSPERSRAKGFVESFSAAAKTGAQLRHPGITRVVQVGRDRGRVFCAAEYVEGRSLRSILENDKPLPVPEALRIAKRVAEVLRYAHSQGVIHGEVKPSNIVLAPGSAVKLTNFGMITNPVQNLLALARATGSTPVYVAPELAIKDALPTARNDVYSLGATLYHLLTGRPPYQGSSPLEVLLRVAQEEAAKPGTLRGALPVEVDEAVMHMLAADPEDRPEDMDQVIRELDDAARAAGASGPTERDAAELVAGAELSADEAAAAAADQRARRKLVGTLTVLAVLLVFAIAALVLVVLAPRVPGLPEISRLPEPPPKAQAPAEPRPPLTRPPPEPK